MEQSNQDEYDGFFPLGPPRMPILLVRTDNTSANLIALYAEFLRLYQLGINSSHISVVVNVLADFLSRPTDPTISHSSRCEQVFQKRSCMRTWTFFRPSPELLQLLDLSLSNEPWQDLPKLPRNLGQLEAAGSTTLPSPLL